MPPTTRPTDILLLSDTHAHYSLIPEAHPLPPASILIHSGDLTNLGSYRDHQRTFSLITSHPAELKIVIPGNHDLTLDSTYLSSNTSPYGVFSTAFRGSEPISAIRELWTGPEAQRHGIVYLEEGTRTFRLRDGTAFTLYASAYTPEFCNWAFAYPRSEDRFSSPAENPVPRATTAKATADRNGNGTEQLVEQPGVDIIVTHGPPMGTLDLAVGAHNDGGAHVGCEALRRAVEQCRPRLHVFGHIHEGYGAVRRRWDGKEREEEREEEGVKGENGERRLDVSRMGKELLEVGRETLFVNASLLDVRYRAVNRPWVVTVELPVDEEKRRVEKSREDGQ
ncbi:MAG: hypothetical protein Q9227_000895 [Pyrenula ochraceoflavens]